MPGTAELDRSDEKNCDILVHKRRFKDEPKPYMFYEDCKWCTECHTNVCEHAEMYYNNDVVYTSKKPKYAELAYTTTIHKSIGDTVEDNVFIINDKK